MAVVHGAIVMLPVAVTAASARAGSAAAAMVAPRRVHRGSAMPVPRTSAAVGGLSVLCLIAVQRRPA